LFLADVPALQLAPVHRVLRRVIYDDWNTGRVLPRKTRTARPPTSVPNFSGLVMWPPITMADVGRVNAVHRNTGRVCDQIEHFLRRKKLAFAILKEECAQQSNI
jgi:hypothetical protein